MHLTDRTVLTTGANRGMGRVLVDAALGGGTKRVYAGMGAPRRALRAAQGIRGLEREFRFSCETTRRICNDAAKIATEADRQKESTT